MPDHPTDHPTDHRTAPTDRRVPGRRASRPLLPALALGVALAATWTLTGCQSAADDPPAGARSAADDGQRDAAEEESPGEAAAADDDLAADAPEPDEGLTDAKPERPAEDADGDGGAGSGADTEHTDRGGDGEEPEEVSPPVPLPLTGTDWDVASVTHGGTTVRADSDVIGRLVFADDGSVGIRACNVISGTADRLGGGRLALDTSLGTRRMCAGLQQELENGIVRFMDGTADYTVAADRLVLSKPNGDRMELYGTRA